MVSVSVGRLGYIEIFFQNLGFKGTFSLLNLLLLAKHFFCLCLVQRLLYHLTSVDHSYDIMFFFVGMELLAIVLCQSV